MRSNIGMIQRHLNRWVSSACEKFINAICKELLWLEPFFAEYLKQDAEGLDFQLYPGELGKRIFNSISKQAWGEWIKSKPC